MSSDDEATEDNRAGRDSFVSFAVGDATEVDDATEENRAGRDSYVSFAMDDATEENRAGRDSYISFAIDGDDIVDYLDVNEESRESSQGSEGSEGSHDEGEDRLGPMEGEVQEPRVLPNQAEMAKQNSKKRLSIVTDIETGKQGGARGHSAHVSVYRVLMPICSASIRYHFSLLTDIFCSVDYPGNCCQPSEKSEIPSSQTTRRFHGSKR
jgi:hypothetical protein